jgi:flavin reductase (DIM6/NTAB) family NADH-FMN oxidoreductase RutF
MSEPAAAPFTERSFRDALALFPTGVAVVTTIAKDGSRLGTTVSSFNSVSLSPPLVLFSIARNSRSFAAWGAAETYAVNILHEHQNELSTRFARTLNERWEGIKPVAGQFGALLIPDALASFECRSYARYDGGDHLIMVGEVLALAVSKASDPRPLIFYKGASQKIEHAEEMAAPRDLDYLLHGW